MSDRPPTRLQTAMHEAGHAVTMLAHQPPKYIDSISIIDQLGDRLGYVDTEARWQPWMANEPAPSSLIEERVLAYRRRAAHLDVIEHLAGPVAELRHRYRSRAGVVLDGLWRVGACISNEAELEPGSDEHRVMVRLRWLEGPDIRTAFEQAWLEAEDVVARHWRRISNLGRWLYRERRIEGKDLHSWWHGLPNG